MPEAEKAKKRILFVDDESSMLFIYELAFKRMRDEWDLFFAKNGDEAIALMERTPCHLIVSDLLMPGMSGTQLLNEIMERFPNTTRIILSGQAERHDVAKCVGAVHQYLLKPCDLSTLEATLRRVCALDVFIRNEKIKAV